MRRYIAPLLISSIPSLYATFDVHQYLQEMKAVYQEVGQVDIHLALPPSLAQRVHQLLLAWTGMQHQIPQDSRDEMNNLMSQLLLSLGGGSTNR